jgi:hypothetical protein
LPLHKTVEEYNNIICDIIGEKIKEVEYFGLRIEYEGEIFSTYKTKFQDVHSFEIELVLHMENGKIYKFIWDNSFECYGIGIIKDNYKDLQNEAVDKWEMTGDVLWEKFIGKKIINASILWRTSYSVCAYSPNSEEIGTEKKSIYPETIMIRFENVNEPIIISASGFLGEGCDFVFSGHDNILVTNNIERAIEIKLL